MRGGAGRGEGPQEPETTPTLDALDGELEAFVPEKGPALGRGEALAAIVRAKEDALLLDGRYALDRYRIGEALVAFAAGKGHVALGYGQLGPCLRERFSLGRTWAYDSMRFARLATRKEIEGMTWEVASLGVELAAVLKVSSFAVLATKELPVPGRDGENVRFPAPPEVLAKALELLKGRKPPSGGEEEEDIRPVERTRAKKAQAVLDRCLADYPALAEAKPKVYFRDGRAQVRLDAIGLGGDTFTAVRFFFDELERMLRK